MIHMHQTTAIQSQKVQPEPKQKSPYFLVDPERVAQIPAQQVKDKFKTIRLGADQMQAYIVQCAGVNGRLADVGRISTHGPNAVADRTTLSRRQATTALAQLVEAGFLEPKETLERGSLPGRVKPTFVVDSTHPGYLGVSQAFLHGRLDQKRAKLGTLKHLIQYVEDSSGIPISLAKMDAIQLYLALLSEQDFAQYSGVDPSLVGALCTRVSSPDDNRLSHSSDCAGVELMTVQVPKELAFHPDFARQILSYGSPGQDMPSDEDRFKLALKNLRRSELLYDAFVLWDGDPTADALRYEPSVIGTLHVGKQRDKNLEDHLEEEMEKLVRDLIVETGTRFDRNDWRVYVPGDSVLRTVVQEHQVARARVMKQIRVRHWGYDANNLGALETDSARVRGEVSRLRKIRKRIINPSEAE